MGKCSWYNVKDRKQKYSDDLFTIKIVYSEKQRKHCIFKNEDLRIFQGRTELCGSKSRKAKRKKKTFLRKVKEHARFQVFPRLGSRPNCGCARFEI